MGVGPVISLGARDIHRVPKVLEMGNEVSRVAAMFWGSGMDGKERGGAPPCFQDRSWRKSTLSNFANQLQA